MAVIYRGTKLLKKNRPSPRYVVHGKSTGLNPGSPSSREVRSGAVKRTKFQYREDLLEPHKKLFKMVPEILNAEVGGTIQQAIFLMNREAGRLGGKLRWEYVCAKGREAHIVLTYTDCSGRRSRFRGTVERLCSKFLVFREPRKKEKKVTMPQKAMHSKCSSKKRKQCSMPPSGSSNLPARRSPVDPDHVQCLRLYIKAQRRQESFIPQADGIDLNVIRCGDRYLIWAYSRSNRARKSRLDGTIPELEQVLDQEVA